MYGRSIFLPADLGLLGLDLVVCPLLATSITQIHGHGMQLCSGFRLELVAVYVQA